MNTRMLAFLAFCLLFMAEGSYALEEIKIGIHAFRPKAQVLAQWAPLAQALNIENWGYHFSIEAYSPDELEAAVAARQVDFVLTSPSQYTLMFYRSGLSAPMATLETLEEGASASAYGGVIFMRADHKAVATLRELAGRSVAISGKDSFGGYLVQAYELSQAGLDVSKDIEFVQTGMPLDNVVGAVMSGKAEFGMVRSGLLENMAREGKLDLDKIQWVNRQNLPHFPVGVSTRLYPEWPIAALPHTNKVLKRKLSAFLLNLEDNQALARALQIYGFQVPADYSPVEMVLQALRIAPFDVTPTFTTRDVWDKYRWEIATGLAASLLILFLSFDLMLVIKRLKSEKRLVEQQTAHIKNNEERWKFALEGAREGVWDVDFQSHESHYSKRYQEMLGYNEGEFTATFDDWPNHIHPEDKSRVLNALDSYLNQLSDLYDVEYRLGCKDGSYKWINARGMVVSRDDQGHPIRMVGTHTDITELKEAESVIWRQANFDALTLLPNRRLFQDRLEQEIRKAQREKIHTALLYIDLDHFKEVNDTLGHDHGDALLIEASSRIKACVRDSDTVSRLGGDEFTVILANLPNVSDVGSIAQNIIDRLTRPFLLMSQESFISASIGIALYPDDAKNLNDLIKNADQAMYVAKNNGRSCFHFFTPAMQQASDLRQRLSRDLRRALQEEQFELYFQPMINLSNGEVHKAEALIRWQHPQHGLISPAEFIPVAEANGTIISIGDWVFTQAVRHAKKWKIGNRDDFQISVNMSPLQFTDQNRGQRSWIDQLRVIGYPGSGVVVEITEGILISEDAKVNKQLLAFRDYGIQVAIDDFGTGYSSLSYLKKFDIDYLKIDQSFTRNLTPDSPDFTLCETIVVMAHKLGLKVIAEGVETSQQFALLKQMNCDYGQGYLFSKPLPAREFEAFLSQI